MNGVFLAGLVSFILVLVLGPATIEALRRLRAGQRIRDEGPKGHAAKSGTPTMGGVVIVVGASLGTLLFATPRSTDALYLLIAFVGFALIGMLDDFIKVVAKRSLGLRARQKLIGQLLFGALITLYALNAAGGSPQLIIPFAGATWSVSPLLFVVISLGAMLGTTNAVNITDGLDGLAAGSTSISSAVMGVILYGLGYPDAAIFAAALAGACLGFAWYNAHPAQVFMGDTGALGLGGALGAMAVLSGTHLILVIVGGLFVIETLSVMLQVTYFRLTRGKRIFRMSPIHHHFELSGWAEPQIVTRFWVLALLFGLVGLLAVQ